MQIVRAHEHRRMPWANGGGWTTEIVAAPDPQHWSWRVSMADIDTDGPFSVLDGVARTIALVAGKGCVLRVEGQGDHLLDVAFVPFDFDGGATTGCRLLDGPVQDLNLMQRGRRTRSLRFVTVGTDATRIGHADVVIVMSGQVASDGVVLLDRLDAVLDGDDLTLRAVGPDAVVAVIGPADTAESVG